MIYWLTKGFALVTVIALVMGLAAETTTLMGDVQSPQTNPTTTNKNQIGIMLAVQKQQQPKGKKIVCEAYKWGTDFPQRGGAIFHGGLYHALTILTLLIHTIHHGLRGLVPRNLAVVFKYFPSLQGGRGLAGSGIVMIYIAFQIMSYSVGKYHLFAALALLAAGLLNIGSIMSSAIVAATAERPLDSKTDGGGGAMDDPYAGDMGMGGMGASGGGGGFDDDDFGGYDPYGGAPPRGGPSAPEADQSNADELNDGIEGVGASAPPPGMIDRQPEKTTTANDDGDDDGSHGKEDQMVFNPATGMWNTAPAMPANAMLAPYGAPYPMYDAWGRPLPGTMNPYAAAGMQYPPKALDADTASNKRSIREIKRKAKKAARKKLERKLRRQEERSNDGWSSEEEERQRRQEEEDEREYSRQQELERVYQEQIQAEEQRRQHVAKAEAMQDAHHRNLVDTAAEDARRCKYEDMITDERSKAMTHAQREAMQREEVQRQQEYAYRAARQRAEQDAWEKEMEDERQLAMQRQTMAAAHQAAGMGNPLDPYSAVQDGGAYSNQPEGHDDPAGWHQDQGQHPAYSGQHAQPPAYGMSQHQHTGDYNAREQQYAQQQHQQQQQIQQQQAYYPDDRTEIQSVVEDTASRREMQRLEEQRERQRVLERQAMQRRAESRDML